MGCLTTARLIDGGAGPVVREKTTAELEAVRKQMIAQQEFVRVKHFANLSGAGVILAFDAAADMRTETRKEVLDYVQEKRRIRRREVISICKMVHRIHRRIEAKGLRITWGFAVRYPEKLEATNG